MKTETAILRLAAIATAAATFTLRAQVPVPMVLSADASAQQIGRAGVGNSAANVGVVQAGVQAGYPFLNLSYDVFDYDWKQPGALRFARDGKAPWEQLHDVSIRAAYARTLNSTWDFLAGARLISSFEDEAAGSLNGRIFGGARYNVSPSCFVVAGGFGLVRPVASFAVPVVSLIFFDKTPTNSTWQISPGYPESRFRYNVSPRAGIQLEVVPDNNIYRLADDSSVAGKGYVETKIATVSLALDAAIRPQLHLLVGPTWNFRRSLTFYDQDGHEMTFANLSDEVGGFARLHYEF